jgi:hypothetical protein
MATDMLKRSIISILAIASLEVLCAVVGVLNPGVDLFILPLHVFLILIGLYGLFTIPLMLYKYFKKQAISKLLLTFTAASVGYFAGYFLEQPIYQWDEKQRNISGQIMATAIEKFHSEQHRYPGSLHQLNEKNLNGTLPKTYQVSRFEYRLIGNDYHLELLIPFFDRWKWDRNERRFVYEDF